MKPLESLSFLCPGPDSSRSRPKGSTLSLRSSFRRDVVLCSLAAMPLVLAAQTGGPGDLAERSIEDLSRIEVRSASRTPQTLVETSAAIHVITQEDIRRSGATTIAEALRMAPGVNVARIDANKWAVSTRGFNDFFSNKLLVLQDGRSVYTPLFSGVFWDVQDTFMEDIKQIEVIRGPGATLWGANAVNGVINIITKDAHETVGGLAQGGGGTEETGFGGIRYGMRLGETAAMRVYAKYFNRDDFVYQGGNDAADEWDIFRTGFRTDWAVSDENGLTLQGDYYTGRSHQQFGPPMFFTNVNGDGDVAGGNVLGRWTRHFSSESELTVQAYYDRTERHDQVHREIRDTYDVDTQHRISLGTRHELIWGLGYRHTDDELGDGRARTDGIRFHPRRRGDHLFSGFVQNEIAIVDGVLNLTLGTKLEHNDYTGFELQPNARLVWTINDRNTAWAAASRAIRSPSRFEQTIETWYFPPPAKLVGNPDFDSEELIAYELGYRVQLIPNHVSLDLAGFCNVYDDLRVIQPFFFVPGPPIPAGVEPLFPAGLTVLPGITYFHPDNLMSGETYGGEVSVNWDVTDFLRVSGGYSFLQMQLHRDATVTAFNPETAEGDSPHHQIHVRSFLDLPHNLQFDTALYYTDNLPNRGVPAYIRVDLRLGWRPVSNLELSLAVQNLLDDRHPEFGPGFLVNPTQIERSVYVKAAWRF